MSEISQANIEGMVSALVGTSDSVIAVMFRLDIDYPVDEMEAALADDLQRCQGCDVWGEPSEFVSEDDTPHDNCIDCRTDDDDD